MSAVSKAFLTWGALLILLALTAASSSLDLGRANIVINLAVAAAKSALVLFIFMHLNEKKVLNWLAGICVCLWLSILYVLTLLDYATR